MSVDTDEEPVSRDVGWENGPEGSAESRGPDSQPLSDSASHAIIVSDFSFYMAKSAATLVSQHWYRLHHQSQRSLLWSDNPFPESCPDPKIL